MATSISPGDFDHVDGQLRGGVAAINATTGQLVAGFHPNGGSAKSVLATASAIYVGSGQLRSFQLNGAATPGWFSPTAIIDGSIRAHMTLPQFRDIAIQGSTLVVACQCDSLTDAVATRNVKAVVEINAATGHWVNWVPAGLDVGSAGFGITVFVHAFPGTGTPTVYLAAGGSDFTAAWDFNTGSNKFKQDTSGSSQTIVWYQGYLVVGGHFNWTLKAGHNGSCQDNADPNPTDCWHTPKLVALDATLGHPMLDNTGNPWNPVVCCKYNGIWALLVGNDGSTLHVGGEFTRAGGTWVDSPLPDPHGLNWHQSGGTTQQFYARFGGPVSNTQTLSLQKTSTAGATGTVTSNPAGINCNTACSGTSADFTTGTNVTLTATASVGNTFLGWSSSDAGFTCTGTGPCTVNMNIARTVTANFAGVTFQLSVTKTGSAAGIASVTSDVGGINCGATCSALIQQSTVVTLTATAGANSQFTGWSGAGCSGTGTCVVTMDAAKSVSANFDSTLASVTVTKATSTTGQGTVTSNPAGISCANACPSQSASFSSPTVTLSQVPKAADAFAGWTSSDPGFSCLGLGDCTVTMDMSRNVVAHFDDAKNVKLSTIGTGVGTVTSDPAIMNCTAPVPSGTTCDQGFAENSAVTLTAAADANSVFTGWSTTGSGSTAVSCTGTAPCSFNMGIAQKQVTATFQPAFPLTVTPAGFGSGTVTSNPAGINCGLTCTANFASGSNVILSAVADASSSTFAGWSGGLCSGTGTCAVPMTQVRNITATFALIQHPLTVHVSGHGTVTTNPGSAIDCVGPTPDPGTCNANFDHGTDVGLIETPDANWAFSGWSGDCTIDPCVVNMTTARDVTATFEQISRTVTAHVAGSGTGEVTSTPAGIACPDDCGDGFGAGNSVTLTQVADAGSIFTGWSGDCTGTGACNLTIDGPKDVTATFELAHHLTVTTDGGTGTGTVTSNVGGISCPSTCTSTARAHNTTVTLTATPDPGDAFAGWSGDGGCTGTALACDVLMDNDHTVTAAFEMAVDLTVDPNGGTGGGTVTTPPNNEIDCPSTCTGGFAENGSATLHAVADANSVFTGWSGDTDGGCLNTSDCTVTMDQSRTITATFQPAEPLTLTPAGSGGGTVTSNPAGISCGPMCGPTNFLSGISVTLSAVSDPNSTFTGWSGDTGGGCLDTGDCTVTMDQARTITATFEPIQWQLSVTTTGGTGTGTVTSTPVGISCGVTCAASFQQGTLVSLNETPDANMAFAGWSGACTGNGVCSVPMSADMGVTATFNSIPHTLTVTKSGTGTGTVTSTPVGISCGVTCAASFQQGTLVSLNETPDANMAFAGWSGACTGNGVCSVPMSADMGVTATFNSIPHTLTVTKSGTGTGTVTSTPVGISCGVTCAASFQQGTLVSLNETPDANMAFAGWSGACTGNGVCSVPMSADMGVTATFNSIPHTLTVTKSGTGTGTVTSTPVGISCGVTCAASFQQGTLVSLNETPDANMAFAGWSGACTGNGVCSVPMSADMGVTATFNSAPNITLKDADPAVAYNGWFGITDNAASGGFYRMSKVTNDSATWKSPATTSITWVTRTGPDQGKASVTIDGVNKGTVDLYSAAPAASNKVYPGLASKVHTIVIKVLGTKNASSTATNVRLDAFIVGATTTQESDTKIQYDTWKSTAQAAATDGTYRSTTNNKATVTVTFTGTSIDWQTTKGKAYGKASVKIDGVAKGTFDMYQAATAWQSPISFTGLSAGPHTMVIQVLGQKNASATSNKVVVDGFIVHA